MTEHAATCLLALHEASKCLHLACDAARKLGDDVLAARIRDIGRDVMVATGTLVTKHCGSKPRAEVTT